MDREAERPVSNRTCLKCIVFLTGIGVVVAVAICVSVVFRDVGKTSDNADVTRTESIIRSAVGNYHYAAVATDSEVCSQIGSYILGRGGSAVDSAIAAMVCLGSVQVHNTGIGGGFFMVIYDTPTSGEKNKMLETLDAREVAPIDSSENMFSKNPQESKKGGKSVAVPGEVRGYWEAHRKYGRLPWKELFQPTIDLCEKGVPITEILSNRTKEYEREIRQDEGLREILINADGTKKKKGDVMKNLKLAETLRRIASDGLAFYEDSSLALDILNDINDHGGIMTLEDLLTYKVEWKPPINISLQNGGIAGEPLQLHTMGIPSGGPVLAMILNILDGYNFSSSSIADVESTILTYHRIIEAFKYAYARRSEMGDSNAHEQLVANMTSEKVADLVRKLINDDRTYDVKHYQPESYLPDSHGTVHLSVHAPDGGAVSATATINYIFGALFRGKRTGIIFNNEMDDFSTPNSTNLYGYAPSPANFIRPGRRPLSSMCPSLLMTSRGNLVLNIGASGGSLIITSVAMTIIQHIWFGKSLGETIDAARLHHQLQPNKVLHDAFLAEDIQKGLQAKGHKLAVTQIPWIVQAIRTLCRDCVPGLSCPLPACLQASSDFRRKGSPSGF